MDVDQRSDGPGDAVGGGEDVPVGDEDAAALVLGEDAEPGGLAHQHLPRPLAVIRTPTAYDPSLRHHWSNTAV